MAQKDPTGLREIKVIQVQEVKPDRQDPKAIRARKVRSVLEDHRALEGKVDLLAQLTFLFKAMKVKSFSIHRPIRVQPTKSIGLTRLSKQNLT